MQHIWCKEAPQVQQWKVDWETSIAGISQVIWGPWVYWWQGTITLHRSIKVVEWTVVSGKSYYLRFTMVGHCIMDPLYKESLKNNDISWIRTLCVFLRNYVEMYVCIQSAKGLSTAEGGRVHITTWSIKIQTVSIFSNNHKLDSGCHLCPTSAARMCTRAVLYTSLAQPAPMAQ